LGTDAKTVLDATGCLVMPGGVDPHVHYSLGFGPVRSESQDFSAAAAYGGTTTVVDFALQQAPKTLTRRSRTSRPRPPAAWPSTTACTPS
jgi:dihydropyrimidinase